MPINRPPSESQPRPRKAVDVLQAVDTEPESELLFDPRVDISESNKEVMFARLGELRSKKSWLMFGYEAHKLSIIFPNRRKDLGLGKREYLGWLPELSILYYGDRWIDYIEEAESFLSLFPDKKSELKLDDRVFNGVKTVLDFALAEMNEANFFKWAYHLAVLFPSRMNEIGFVDWILDEVMIDINYARTNGDWKNFCAGAEKMFILFPERIKKLELGEGDFNEMKYTLSQLFKAEYLDEAMAMAKSMTVLSAESVEVDSFGQIKLVYKKGDIVRKRKPLPIVSKV